MTRIRLKINEITSDAALDRATLEAALEREVARITGGAAGLTGGYRPHLSADLATGQGGLAERVAGAAAGAVVPGNGGIKR